MDSKFYVSLEAEELLIEKGYPIEKDTPIYNERGDVLGYFPADRPTKAEAIDWLESKGALISPHPVTVLREDGTTETHWSCHIVHKDGTWYTTNDLPTRLEAEDDAIVKALELL